MLRNPFLLAWFPAFSSTAHLQDLFKRLSPRQTASHDNARPTAAHPHPCPLAGARRGADRPLLPPLRAPRLTGRGPGPGPPAGRTPPQGALPAPRGEEARRRGGGGGVAPRPAPLQPPLERGKARRQRLVPAPHGRRLGLAAACLPACLPPPSRAPREPLRRAGRGLGPPLSSGRPGGAYLPRHTCSARRATPRRPGRGTRPRPPRRGGWRRGCRGNAERHGGGRAAAGPPGAGGRRWERLPRRCPGEGGGPGPDPDPDPDPGPSPGPGPDPALHPRGERPPGRAAAGVVVLRLGRSGLLRAAPRCCLGRGRPPPAPPPLARPWPCQRCGAGKLRRPCLQKGAEKPP